MSSKKIMKPALRQLFRQSLRDRLRLTLFLIGHIFLH
jgi:hypothetical protein